MGRIPPDESHPLYGEWMAASIRILTARKKLEEISEADPEFAAVHSECEAAKAAYDAILTKIIERIVSGSQDASATVLSAISQSSISSRVAWALRAWLAVPDCAQFAGTSRRS
jgi:hypothetical protein